MLARWAGVGSRPGIGTTVTCLYYSGCTPLKVSKTLRLSALYGAVPPDTPLWGSYLPKLINHRKDAARSKADGLGSVTLIRNP